MKIVLLGTGEMTSVTARALAQALSHDDALVLLDVDEAAAQRVAGMARAESAGCSIASGFVDVFDAVGLRAALFGADLALLGAGPFIRTAEPVLRACLAEHVDMLDIGDDAEAVEMALAMHPEAVQAGICVSMGCGASPGLSNLLAAQAADVLDEVDSIDVGWVVGDEGPQELGTAVLRHWVHCVAGDCRTWRDGAIVTVDSFVASEVLPFAPPLNAFRVFECPHPEPLTLSRRYPRAHQIRCLGGLHPVPVTGLSRGIGQAVRAGRMNEERAVDFFRAALADRVGPLTAWPPALGGLLAQVRRREVSGREAVRFLINSLRGRHGPCHHGLVAVARGRRDGLPAKEVRALSTGSFPTTMAEMTGRACAAFTLLALDRRAPGVRAPEDWVRVEDLVGAYDRAGVPPLAVLHESTTTGPVPPTSKLVCP